MPLAEGLPPNEGRATLNEGLVPWRWVVTLNRRVARSTIAA